MHEEQPHDLGMKTLKVVCQIGMIGGLLLLLAAPGMHSWLAAAAGLIVLVICGSMVLQMSVEIGAREELEQLSRAKPDHSAGLLLIPGGVTMLIGFLMTLVGIPAGFYGDFWIISIYGVGVTIAGSALIAFLLVFEYVLAPLSINHARAVLSHETHLPVQSGDADSPAD